MARCCEDECDVSLIMGYCPRRTTPSPVRGGIHPAAAAPELPLEPMPWPQPEPLLQWVGKAKPGERFTYFTGFLAATPGAKELAKAAMQLRAAGAIVLFQKRVRPGEFAYIAERRSAGGGR